MPLLLTIITLLLLAYLLRKPKPMFETHLNYKVTFNDLTHKDHPVKQANIKGDFGHLLEELQAQQSINNLTVLDSWDTSEQQQQTNTAPIAINL